MDDDPFNMIDRHPAPRHRDPQRGRRMLDTLWVVGCLTALLVIGSYIVRALG
jgi:hypothetical protein